MEVSATFFRNISRNTIRILYFPHPTDRDPVCEQLQVSGQVLAKGEVHHKRCQKGGGKTGKLPLFNPKPNYNNPFPPLNPYNTLNPPERHR